MASSLPPALKRLGQNFLIDPNIIRKIVSLAALGPEDTVLEIGPGRGALTAGLCAEAGRVIAVEIDPQLQPHLQESLGQLLDLLISLRIVLLYSPSGAGKSSLINATIINEMINQGFNVLPTIRVNQTLPDHNGLDSNFNRYVYSALLSMESELTEFKQLSNEQLYELSISAYLREPTGQRAVAYSETIEESPPILLIFDQLEEIITLDPTDRTAKQEFFRQVGDALQDQNIWALFINHEDYIAALDPYLRFVPTRLSNGDETLRFRKESPAAAAS